jgi:hypothetical protein
MGPSSRVHGLKRLPDSKEFMLSETNGAALASKLSSRLMTRLGATQSASQAAGLLRFLVRCSLLLRKQIRVPEARSSLADRLKGRSERLLDRFRVDVFDRPGSVYHGLMRNAGCEYGDLVRAVQVDGVEGALTRLFHSGVYLTIDEFKGRQPIRRGTFEFPAGPELLRSPRALGLLSGSSGGSRSSGTVVLFDLNFVRDCASNLAVFLDAAGGSGWTKGDWETPGAAARFRLLKFSFFGQPADAWFTQVDTGDPGFPAALRWSTRALRGASLLAGRPIPAPVYASLADPTAVAHWLSRVLATGQVPFLFTFAGSAVRVCLTAMEKDIPIAGAHFMLTGEPITQARVDTIRRAGGTAIGRYGSVETSAIAYGCLRSEHADEMHCLTDMHAVIQACDGNSAGFPENALMMTMLHPRSPFLMLNVSMGDQAEVHWRRCDCPLYQMGWTTMMRDIRSYEKLTGNGVTFLGADVIRILEQVLPARFGGGRTISWSKKRVPTASLASTCAFIHPLARWIREPLLPGFLPRWSRVRRAHE